MNKVFVTAQTEIGQHIKATRNTRSFPRRFAAPQSHQGPDATAGVGKHQKNPIKENFVCNMNLG